MSKYQLNFYLKNFLKHQYLHHHQQWYSIVVFAAFFKISCRQILHQLTLFQENLVIVILLISTPIYKGQLAGMCPFACLSLNFLSCF